MISEMNYLFKNIYLLHYLNAFMSLTKKYLKMLVKEQIAINIRYAIKQKILNSNNMILQLQH